MRIHRHRQRKPKLNIPKYRVNEQINAPEVRVVDPDSGPLGVMATDKAIALAAERELDLVEVSPKADPPVCKILDFGQFKYQKEKEVKRQKSQSKEVEVKGIRLTFRMGEGDRDTRLKQAKKFLERGDKVKIDMMLRGREKAHKPLAKEKIGEFIEDIREFFPVRLEQEISVQGGRMTATIARQ